MLKQLKLFKNYDMFESLSTFAIKMISIFIPIYLFKLGFGLHNIFLYFLVYFIVCFFTTPFLCAFGNLHKYKWLIMISSIFLGFSYIILYKIPLSNFWLVILGAIYGLYSQCYHVGREYYLMSVIPKKNMGTNIGKITISSTIAGMFAVYIGAVILDEFGVYVACIVSIIIFLISILFLSKVPENNDKEILSFDFSPIVSKFSQKNYVALFLHQFMVIEEMLFPLYLFIYLNYNIEELGVFGIISSFSSLLFLHYISRKMDKDKNDYIMITSIFLAIILFLKVNINNAVIVMLLGFFEGMAARMYELSYLRNIIFTGRNYNHASYNLFSSIISSFSQLILFLLVIFLGSNLKNMIIICIMGILLNAFVKYDDGRGGYN